MTTNDVSLIRLYALRGTYALIVVCMGGQMWPLLFNHRPWTVMHGVAVCMLAAISAVSALGLRYPLKMLPLFFFEIVWKATWLLAIAAPLWRSGTMDANTWDTATACLMGVIFLIVIPWRYVFETYVKAPGDRWR